MPEKSMVEWVLTASVILLAMSVFGFVYMLWHVYMTVSR